MQRSALCRSRRELSNAYLLAKIGVDTAENEPLEVWGENSIQYSLHSLEEPRGVEDVADPRNREGQDRQKTDPDEDELDSAHLLSAPNAIRKL